MTDCDLESGPADERQADRQLAARARVGDAGAFAQLFDAHVDPLYRYALLLARGDPDAAAELVQRTFCRAFERLDGYRGEAPLRAWLRRICHNVHVDDVRALRRERAVIVDVADEAGSVAYDVPAPAGDEPPAHHARQELRRQVHAALDTLPARQSEALELKYLEGCTVDEIACRWNVTAKAVESLLSRARSALRDRLAGTGDARAPVERPQRRVLATREEAK